MIPPAGPVRPAAPGRGDEEALGGPTPRGAPKDADADAAAGLRLVVVEDEAVIAMELEDLLAEMGATVVGTAINAEQAVRLAETLRPDCLTMDIRIQGPRDGISAAIEIYERFGVRSVFVSAFGNPETVARARAAHPAGWVGKPVRPAELAAAFARFKAERGD